MSNEKKFNLIFNFNDNFLNYSILNVYFTKWFDFKNVKMYEFM